MYMSSEGQAIFINYAPGGQTYYNDDFPVHAYQGNSFSYPSCKERRKKTEIFFL